MVWRWWWLELVGGLVEVVGASGWFGGGGWSC